MLEMLEGENGHIMRERREVRPFSALRMRIKEKIALETLVRVSRSPFSYFFVWEDNKVRTDQND